MNNKAHFQKYNDKKVLHKIHKQWVTVSLTLLALFGYKAATTNIHADANPQGTNLGQINNNAQAMHTTLLTNASTTPATAMNKGQTTPVQQIQNLNQLKMNQTGNFQGVTYKRVTLPTHAVKVNDTTILLHSNINSIGYVKNYYHSLHRAKHLHVTRAFINEKKHLLRFEVAGPDRHVAFITGHDVYVTRLPESTNYRYYEHKIEHLLAHHPSSNLKGMQHSLKRLLKQGNHNYQRYLRLYNHAYDKVNSLEQYNPIYTHRSIRDSYNHLYSDTIKALVTPPSKAGFNFNPKPASNGTTYQNVQPLSQVPAMVEPESASASSTSSASASSTSSSASDSSNSKVSSNAAQLQSMTQSNAQLSSSANTPALPSSSFSASGSQSNQGSSVVSTSNQSSSAVAPNSNQTPSSSVTEPDHTSANSDKNSNSQNPTPVSSASNKTSESSNNSSDLDNPILNQIKAEILKDVNKDRQGNGVPVLTENADLDRVANLRAQQIITNFSHYEGSNTGQDNALYVIDAKKLNIKLGNYGGENIGDAGSGELDSDTGTKVADYIDRNMMYYDAASNWGHKKNILSGNYKQIGIGSSYDQKTGLFFVAEDFEN